MNNSSQIVSDSKRIVISGYGNIIFEMPKIYETTTSKDYEQHLQDISDQYLKEGARLRRMIHDPQVRKLTSEKLIEKIRVSFSLVHKGCTYVYKFEIDNLKYAQTTCKIIDDLFNTGYVGLR